MQKKQTMQSRKKEENKTEIQVSLKVSKCHDKFNAKQENKRCKVEIQVQLKLLKCHDTNENVACNAEK